MNARQLVARGINDMPWRDMNDLAKWLEAALTNTEKVPSAQEIAETLAAWADTVDVPRTDSEALGPTAAAGDDIDEDGSLKQRVRMEGQPDPGIPGGVVSGAGSPRRDLPRARPVDGEAPLRTEDGYVIDPDGSVRK